MEPCSGEWAIPGDHVHPDEDLPDAANRILNGLTNLADVKLHQGRTFGHPNRHPEGRVITCAYFTLMRMDELLSESDSWADEVMWVPLHKIPSLALDHQEIIASTYADLQRKLHCEPICFDLLPEKFTLSEMQQLYEYAFEVEMDKANFRKKIKYVPLIDLKEKQKNVKHRPASLFSFNSDEYEELVEEGSYLFRM